MNPKLKISVNKNPTKEGIKIQFILPEQIEGDNKIALTQKLQSKLNNGLSPLKLTSNIDTDVPYGNIIGFFIPIQDIKMMIKNAINSGNPVKEEPPVE